jgi:hypothetical protein
MRETLVAVVAAPALVAVATLVARRWDQRVAGVVSAFPAIVGPVLLLGADDHGVAFAAEAATGTLLGLLALSAFTVAYGHAASRWGWSPSLAAGWAAAALVGTLVATVEAPASFAAAAALMSLALAYRALGQVVGRRPAAVPAPPRWDLPFRMVATAALVAALPAAAGRLGPTAGGVLAALPVLASVLAVFTHAQGGAAAAVTLLRGMLVGMGGFVAFCALVAALVEDVGVLPAFTLATAAALAAQALGAATSRPAARASNPVA